MADPPDFPQCSLISQPASEVQLHASDTVAEYVVLDQCLFETDISPASLTFVVD